MDAWITAPAGGHCVRPRPLISSGGISRADGRILLVKFVHPATASRLPDSLCEVTWSDYGRAESFPICVGGALELHLDRLIEQIENQLYVN